MEQLPNWDGMHGCHACMYGHFARVSVWQHSMDGARELLEEHKGKQAAFNVSIGWGGGELDHWHEN